MKNTEATNAGQCTAINKNGKRCKRVAYNWPNGQVLCPPHAFAARDK